MARARLHLICGNCGCDDEFKWAYYPTLNDHGDGTFSADVGLTCKNCSTIHWLSEKAEPADDQRTGTRE